MSSLVAWPGVPRSGAAPSNLLASSLAFVLIAGSVAAPRHAVAQTAAAPAASASDPAHQHGHGPGHDMTEHDKPAAKATTTDKHAAMHMKSAFGPYPMSREGSGTSWQPDATPMLGMHGDDGRLVAHGAWLCQPHP